jgi:hypothetical protein
MRLISRRRGSTDANPWPGYPQGDTQHRDTEARIQALVDGCAADRPAAAPGDGWTFTAEVIAVRPASTAR